MREAISRRRLTVAVGLLAIAALSSLPRFGQRENEQLPVSDSDVYLQMARVFSGQEAAFDPEMSDSRLDPRAHHYSRPLLPFVSGQLVRLTGLSHRTAFSIVNVLLAWMTALLLWGLVAGSRLELNRPWLPGLLFLVSFPQLNWGYHILTDTSGFALTLASAVWIDRLCRRAEDDGPVAAGLVGLVALQSLAFLARGTGWIAVVVAAWWLAHDGLARRRPGFAVAVAACLGLAFVPRELYVAAWDVDTIGILHAESDPFDARYALDFLVKSGVAFHLAWLAAAYSAARTRLAAASPIVVGWTVGALFYMGAGYLHNWIGGVGYPLRMTFALFPLVLPLAADGIERTGRRLRAVPTTFAFVALYAVVSLIGVALDPAAGRITILDLVPGIDR